MGLMDIDPEQSRRYRAEQEEMIYKTLAILTARLGGKVELNQEDFATAPVATLHRETATGKITITTEDNVNGH